MVKIEKNSKKQRKWDGKEDITNADVPEMYQPSTVRSRIKGFAGRQCRNVDVPHMANVNESSKKDNGQGGTIVFQKLPHVSLEKTATPEFTTDPPAHEDQQSDHDAQVSRCLPNSAPLSRQDLDPFLKVDKGNVESKNVA